MKRILSVTLSLLLLLSCVPVGAVAVAAEEWGEAVSGDAIVDTLECVHTYDDAYDTVCNACGYERFIGLLNYEVEDGEVTITGYTFVTNHLVIPATIEGYPVTKIGDQAFWGCESLVSVTLPEGVTYIGDCAFINCYGLTEISIPSTVTEIHPWAFKDCLGLMAINVAEENTIFCSVDGVLYTESMNTLLCYPCSRSDEYIIPEGVEVIGEAAFYNNDRITMLTIPASLSVVEARSFNAAFNLTVCYGGSKLDRTFMSFGDENIYLEEATWYYGTSEEGCVHQRAYPCDDTCQLCGEREDRSALHHWVHVPYKAPTCVELGNIEYWYCDVCGVASLEEWVMRNTNLLAVRLPKLDHEYDSDTDPDCNVCGERREVVSVGNLLVNGDFETGDFTGWTYDDEYASISTDAHSGRYAMQMSNPRAWSEVVTQIISVEPNSEYTISWYSKRVSGTGTFDLFVMNSTDWANLQCISGQNWMNETSGNWVRNEYVVNTGSATAMYLKFSAEGSNAGSMMIDSVTLRKMDSDEPDEPEEPDEPTGNLVVNGDFETGDNTGWSIWQDTVVSSDAAYNGNYGAHLQGNGDWGGMLYQTVPVIPGETYTVSLWIKVLSNGVNLQIKDGDGSGVNLAGRWVSTTSWTQYTFEVTPTADTLFINFCGGGNGVSESVYVDEVTIRAVTFDGYITNGDFETGDNTGWNIWQDTVVSSDAAYNGNYGIYLQGNGSWAAMANQTVAVEIGKTYTLSFYAKVDRIGVIAMIGDGNNYLMNQWLGASDYTEWTLFQYEFTATTDSIVVSFCGAGSGATESAYVDDITLALVDEDPEICYHEYDHAADPDCNLCGEERELRYMYPGSTELITVVESYDTVDFLFTPGCSGNFDFYSEGSTDAYGYIYDIYGNQLYSNDDSGNDTNFWISCYLEAGNTYVLRAGCYGTRTGSYTAYLVCVHEYDADCDTHCNVCGEWREAYHEYDNACDADCDLCGGGWREVADHVYDSICDAYCNECDAWRAAEHVYNTPCDEYCIECGEWRETAHVYDNGCDGECNECGATREWTHSFDDATDTECNECGAIREVRYVTLNSTMSVVITVGQTTDNYLFTPERDGYYIFTCDDIGDPYGHLYDADGNWIADDDDGGPGNREFYIHWYAEAGFTYVLRAGFYSNNTGSYTAYLTCGHMYDDDCDSICNTCDEVREAPHWYDHACDPDCNACGAIREVGDHHYISDCDEYCNECGEWREAAEHVYDNACDDNCDYCGNWREVGDHIYDDSCDEDCNECGYWREGEHVYDYDCDEYCNLCGYQRYDISHTYDNAADSTCNGCGAERVLNYITLDTPATVTVTVSGGTMNFLFTPTHSGEYIFYSDDINDPYGYVYDAYGNLLMSDDDSGPGNRDFRIVYYMEAGVTYELRGGFWSSYTGSYTVYLTTTHTYDNDCDADCNTCGAIREPLHVYDTDCDVDCNACGAVREAADHWYDNDCDVYCNACGYEREAAGHVYDSDCDAYCNVCGEWREPETEHSYDNECDVYCNGCGYERETYHVYDNNCDVYCNVCGEGRDVDGHVYDSALDTDCNECGAVRVLNYISLNTPVNVTVDVSYGTMNFLFTPEYSGEYTFYSSENGDPYGYIYDIYGNELARDDDSGNGLCFRIVYYLEAGVTYELRGGCYSDRIGSYTAYLTRNHEYDSVCDPDCNICGAVRDAYHVYDNACDADCNVCGETREAADHVYAGGCDEYCDVCGVYRVTMIAPHTYDNGCDAYCNECGQHREVADHWYDDACDAYCNECGAAREAHHVYDNACDQYCNACDSYRVGSAHVFADAYDLTCDVCGTERTLQYMELDTDTTVTVDRPRGTECFLFTPEESGDYILYSSCNGDPYGYIYDAYGNLLARDDDSGAGLEFRIVYYLEAGVTYEIRGGYWSTYTGTYTMRLEHYVEEEHPEEPDEPVEPSFDGYITNGDFATGDTTDWEVYHNTEVSEEAAYNGKFGLHLQGDGSGRVLADQSFDVEAGKTYVISMWIKAISEGVNVIVRDVLFAGDLENRWVDNTEWTYVEFIVTPTDTDLLSITFRGGDNGNIESVYVDDIRVVCGVADTCDHTYDNGCDEVCNLCGEWREVAGHWYDDVCDEHCNNCGAWRPTGGHVYDNDRDPDCNECGSLREVFSTGDIDGNGRINMRDLALLIRYINSWDVDIITTSADVNGDGKINVRDAGLLQQYLNGFDVTLA